MSHIINNAMFSFYAFHIPFNLQVYLSTTAKKRKTLKNVNIIFILADSTAFKVS